MIIFTHSASHPTIENHIPSYHVIFVFFYWLIESHHTHLPSTIYNWHTYISFHKIRSEWPFELNIHGWLFVMRTRWHTKNIRHRIFFYQYTHILYTKTHAYFSLYICGVLFVYWFTFWFFWSDLNWDILRTFVWFFCFVDYVRSVNACTVIQ